MIFSLHVAFKSVAVWPHLLKGLSTKKVILLGLAFSQIFFFLWSCVLSPKNKYPFPNLKFKCLHGRVNPFLQTRSTIHTHVFHVKTINTIELSWATQTLSKISFVSLLGIVCYVGFSPFASQKNFWLIYSQFIVHVAVLFVEKSALSE